MLSQSEAMITLGVLSHSHCWGPLSAVAALLICPPLPFKQPESATVQAPSGPVEEDYVNWKSTGVHLGYGAAVHTLPGRIVIIGFGLNVHMKSDQIIYSHATRF